MTEREMRKFVEPEFSVDEFFLRQASTDEAKIEMRKRLNMAKPTHKKKEKLNFYEDLKIRLYKAGLDLQPSVVVKWIFYATLIILAITSFILAIVVYTNGIPTLLLLLYLLVWWIIGFAIIYSIAVIILRVILDYRTFKRTLEVEQVLPEFLRLVATNYRSGMPLDKSIAKSNRKRFGVFSREIELVAKVAKVKGDLARALLIFSKKFNSKILQRAVNNINLSIKSGSNISTLLDDISTNIIKMRNMRKSMAANVKNYIIFIIVAGVIIAPLMFSMSYQMNSTVGDIRAKFLTQQEGTVTSTPSFITSQNMGEGGISPQNYNIFAILIIITNSVVSSFLISIIRHGNFEQGMRYIPMFAIASIILYFIGKAAFSGLLAAI